jgi:hypothetical protein
MDQGTINWIIICSCLLGIVVGWALVRWSQRQLALMANERQVLLKGRLGLWGRRVHARALMAGGAALFALGVMGLFDVFFRH